MLSKWLKKNITHVKLLLLILLAAFLTIGVECPPPPPGEEKVPESEAKPFSIFIFKHSNPNTTVREAEFFAEKGYPCEVYRTVDNDYMVALGGYTTQEEADSILNSIPDSLFAPNANPYVGQNSGFLGVIYSKTPPDQGNEAFQLGDYCIPVYNTGNYNDATEFAEDIFEKGFYTEIYETGPNDFTVTIGAFVTLAEAEFKLREAIFEGVAPRGSEIASRAAYGTRLYPQ